MHVSSLLGQSVDLSHTHISPNIASEPIPPASTRPQVSEDKEELLQYAATMIDAIRRERALERKAHQKTKEWAYSRIATLEAQLSRREAELAQCATHCATVRDPPPQPQPDEGPAHQQYRDTLQWTISKNRSLELEISALREKVSHRTTFSHHVAHNPRVGKPEEE